MKKTIFTSLMLFSVLFVNAQDEDKKTQLGLFVGPAFGKISNINIDEDPFASVKNNANIMFGLNTCRYFNKHIGFMFGLEYSRFKSIAEYKGFYRSSTLVTDRDGYNYYPEVVTNYKETRTLNFIDIPLAFRFEASLGEFAQFFADVGLKFNLTVTSKFEQTGSIDNKGAYPNNNVAGVYLVLENFSYYGFYHRYYSTSSDLKANKLNYSFIVNAGIKSKLTKNSYLLLSPCYMFGLNNFMSNNGSKEYENILGEKKPMADFNISQFAIKLGVVFDL